MTTNNPDVLHPTRGSKAHEERLAAVAWAEQIIRDLSAVYGGDPLLKKDVVDAVAFEQGCSQETAQSYVDALCSIHPRAPFLNFGTGSKTRVAIKHPQLLNEDANLSASKKPSEQSPKTSTPRAPRQARKGGANA